MVTLNAFSQGRTFFKHILMAYVLLGWSGESWAHLPKRPTGTVQPTIIFLSSNSEESGLSPHFINSENKEGGPFSLYTSLKKPIRLFRTPLGAHCVNSFLTQNVSPQMSFLMVNSRHQWRNGKKMLRGWVLQFGEPSLLLHIQPWYQQM